MGKFRTVYERERHTSCVGDPVALEYGLEKDEKGASYLTITGKFSLYDQIQAYRDSCDLGLILDRFMKTGDVSLLQQRQGFYADTTEYPKNYAEMLQLAKKAEEFFYTLDADARAEFNNDPDQFFASIGSEKFNKIFSEPVIDDLPVESEVKSNE